MTRLTLFLLGVVLLASSSVARSEPVAAQVQLLPPAGTRVEVQPVGRYYARYYARPYYRPYARYYAPRAYYYAPRPRYYANYYAAPYYSAPYYDGYYYGPRAYYRGRWAY